MTSTNKNNISHSMIEKNVGIASVAKFGCGKIDYNQESATNLSHP